MDDDDDDDASRAPSEVERGARATPRAGERDAHRPRASWRVRLAIALAVAGTTLAAYRQGAVLVRATLPRAARTTPSASLASDAPRSFAGASLG
ncbi:unnamed product, partial [Ostreococcus tauri]